MQTRPTSDPLQPKTWQLDNPGNSGEGFLYYCVLCDEALVLSKQEIDPKQIQLVFDYVCPGCHFDLDRVLNCKPSLLPPGRRLLTSLKCRDAQFLLEQDPASEYETHFRKGLTVDPHPSLTSGIEAVDRVLTLRKGQLVYLQGKPAHALSLLLCARATLPPPDGLNSDVIFIDGGNNFDTYTISQYADNQGLDARKIQERIHVSRGFTHHQIFNLLTDKIAATAQKDQAGLAVVSDITALFCDPDVREKKESLNLFRKSIRLLATIAQAHNMIILVTNLETRNKKMEDTLETTAHIVASLEGRGSLAKLSMVRHPETQHTRTVVLDFGTLTQLSKADHIGLG